LIISCFRVSLLCGVCGGVGGGGGGVDRHDVSKRGQGLGEGAAATAAARDKALRDTLRLNPLVHSMHVNLCS
jgi:hypothetical protein